MGLLEKIEHEDLIIYQEKKFDGDPSEYIKRFNELVAQGKLEGDFEDRSWIGDSGIKKFGLSFDLNLFRYRGHTFDLIGIPLTDIARYLKCYALSICGKYIFLNLQNRLNVLRAFLENYDDADYHIKETEICWIEDFLLFCGLSAFDTEIAVKKIPTIAVEPAKMRTLANFVNYLSVAEEIRYLYQNDPDDEEFIRWFPVCFWVEITMLIPLRATEMLVTPLDCIHRTDDGKVILRLRRTQLKKGKRIVHYDERDYKIFEYPIPDTPIVAWIEKYKKLTEAHKRRFLFTYDWQATNEIFSLVSFSDFLDEFVDRKLAGNPRYDYALFASGIAEFEHVNAGDSRPIAMANIYFQGCSADICRQLADHESVEVSSDYFLNVSHTVEASSVMHYQKQINEGYADLSASGNYEVATGSFSGCLSPHRPMETGEIDDCGDHFGSCIGCPFYRPTEEELTKEIEKRRAELDEASKDVLKCMGANQPGTDFEKVFSDVQTRIARFKEVSDVKAKGEIKKWQRYRSTKTIC